MRFSTSIAVAVLASTAFAAPAPGSPTATDTADVYAAQATAKTETVTSKVKGHAFDRYVSIWLENTDYDQAVADPTIQALSKLGITLTNYFAVTHPSEPNYMSVFSGEYFGLDGDAFETIPSNVSTIADVLDDKKISWSVYEEDMPYSGYQGFSWVNPKTGANDYVRKHNPAIVYNSIANNADRLAKIKNTTVFYEELTQNELPQWLFITPNMLNDGHDTSVTYAATWLKGFLTPLLSDKNFMDNTLVHITFDENENYAIQNKIYTILIGDSIPSSLVGTTDDNYYNHYSELSTVEANWDLYTLGRWDVGANVFANVAAHTGDDLRKWTPDADDGFVAFSNMYFNSSYPGILNSKAWAPQPVPDIHSRRNGRTTLQSIKDAWPGSDDLNYYHGQLEIPDGMHPPPKTPSP